MKLRRRLLLVGVLMTLLIGFEPVGAAQEVCPYSLTLTKTQFTRHEPILLNLAITNSSAEPLPVSLGFDREGAFIFTLRRPDGSVIELPRKQIRQGISLIGKFNVGAGQSYTQQLRLNEWYDFPDMGLYEIGVRLSNRTGAETVCLNARFNIEITPLDTVQLAQACAELVETVKRNDNNAGNVLDAGKALLIVKHPLVVRFLEEVLRTTRAADWLMITGLERIGNEEARNALLKIQGQITDPSTLELVKAALARVSN